LFPLFTTEFRLNSGKFYVEAWKRFKNVNGRDYLGLINLGVRETCCERGGDLPMRPLHSDWYMYHAITPFNDCTLVRQCIYGYGIY
jgi:hypothetical protein